MNYTIEQLQAMSPQELKALAYDNLVNIENMQKGLEVLNKLIADKSKKPLSTPDVKVEEKK